MVERSTADKEEFVPSTQECIDTLFERRVGEIAPIMSRSDMLDLAQTRRALRNQLLEGLIGVNRGVTPINPL